MAEIDGLIYLPKLVISCNRRILTAVCDIRLGSPMGTIHTLCIGTESREKVSKHWDSGSEKFGVNVRLD